MARPIAHADTALEQFIQFYREIAEAAAGRVPTATAASTATPTIAMSPRLVRPSVVRIGDARPDYMDLWRYLVPVKQFCRAVYIRLLHAVRRQQIAPIVPARALR